jgi:hypothetical protein
MDEAAYINTEVQIGILKLAGPLQEWVREHLIEPREIVLATDPEGKKWRTLWLVTDHISHNDSGYRVVFDESSKLFGLESTLDTDIPWFMGLYGDFATTVQAM